MVSTRENKRKWNKHTREIKKNLLDKYLGIKCLFCSHKERLIAHRKDGKPHKKLYELSVKSLEKEISKGQYVRVCFKCHKAIHWCMKHLNMTWEEIINKFK